MTNNAAKKQLYLILTIVLFGFIGNSIAYPILAPLFLHPQHGDIVPFQWSEKWRSLFLGITLMTYPLGQFIGSPILGALSDRYGRKTILLTTTLIITICYLLTALSLTLNLLWLLIISRFVTGCAEGNISIARSMVVDNKALDRHKSLGLISAMTSFGYIFGPLLGGVLADTRLVSWFSFATPFYAAAFMTFLILILATIFLQESLTSRYDSGITLRQQFNLLKRLRTLCQNKALKVLLIASTIASLSYDTFYEFYPAYMTRLWHATSLDIAFYTVMLSATLGIGCGWLSHALNRYCSSRRLILINLPIMGLILLVLILQPPAWLVMLLFIVIGFAIAIITTNYTLQVSHAAAEHIQGEVFGTLWGLRMLLDGLTSLAGGILLLIHVTLPLALAATAAFVGWIIYYKSQTLQ